MGGDQRQQSNVLIPDTGAAKYWYVDPRAGNQQPSPSSTPFATITMSEEQRRKFLKAQYEAMQDALKRMGVTHESQDGTYLIPTSLLPEGTQPQF
jgi:hypothetical protein